MVAVAVLGAAAIGAGATAYASNKSADAQKKAAALSNQTLQQQYQQTRSDLAPYRDAGASALGTYRDVLGLNGRTAADKAFSTYQQSPYLPYLINQTVDAVDHSRAAHGGLFSGGTATEIGNRAGQLHLADINNWVTRLGGLADSGQGAASATGQFGANAAQGQASNLMALGNSQANNAINQSNNFNSMLGQFAQAYGAQQGGAYGNPYGSYLGKTAQSILGG